MISQEFKNLKVCFLSTGVGAGSKLLQSYLDGSKEILMIPSYILMYLYPNWKLWIKSGNKNWSFYLKKLLIHHPSFLNSSKLPGSSDLNKLGKNKKNFITINKKLFLKKSLELLQGEEITLKNFILAVHISYAICQKENLKKKKILFYHAHEPEYINKMLKIFPNAKVISMYRDIRENLPGRVFSSLNKVNLKYLNKSDVFLMNIRSYQQSLFRNYFGISNINNIPNKAHKIVSYDDLVKNKDRTLKKIFKFLNIKFDTKINLLKTFSGYQWNSTFYKNKKKNFKDFYYFWELIWLKYLYSRLINEYDNKKKIKFFNFIFFFPLIILPSKYEIFLISKIFSINFIKNYYISVIGEMNSNKNLIYKKWGYYEFKWYSKNYPFTLKNFFLIRLNQSKIFFWKIVYVKIKILEYIIFPIFIFFNYLIRIMNCITFTILRFYPSILPSKLF